MPVIRFVREGRDVECYPGENLREVALREGIQLYGLKGTLGNCGGCGQCITCFVEIPEANAAQALSGRTAVEEQKLRRRPQNWRLACQALVQGSLVVVTRPQVGLAGRDSAVASALEQGLPDGPTEWPQPLGADSGSDGEAERPSAEAGDGGASATSDEGA
jgi:ferredoxin